MGNFKEKLRTFTMVFALIAIWVIFGVVTQGSFLQMRNLSNLLLQMSVTGVIAVGMVLVIVAGHIDLSVGSVACFLGATMAILGSKYSLGPTATIGITLGLGMILGTLTGALVSYAKIPAFIVTLGNLMIFRGASMWITESKTITPPENWLASIGSAALDSSVGWVITALGCAAFLIFQLRARTEGRRHGLEPLPLSGWLARLFGPLIILLGAMVVFSSYQGVPYPVLILGALLVLVHLAATQTTWGRHIFALGGNLEAARLSGVRVQYRTLSIFVLMGALCAIAGVIMTTRVGSASPDAGQLLELDAIAACVIGGTSLMGGKGSIPGAILGALLMESLNNGMSMANMEPYWQYIVKGVVLVAAVWADVASQDKRR